MASLLSRLTWLAAAVGAASVTIDNTKLRTDSSGNLLNAHDGNILLVDGTYWMIGTRYPDCVSTGVLAQPHCGWGMRPNEKGDCWGMWGDNDFAVYSSPDLVRWTLQNPQALPSHTRPRGTYFRPKLLHAPQNSQGERFVLWGNYVNMTLSGTSGSYFTAVSPRPAGPFTIKEWNISMGTGWTHNGDFALFADDDGKGYIDYHSYGCPSWPGVASTPCEGVDGSHAVDLLTPDFTSSTRQTSGLFDIRGSEAPVMFKRNSTYYILTATGCGFCPEGSDARPWIAQSALGPYTDSGKDINPCRNASIPYCGLMKNGLPEANALHVVPAQQAFVLELPRTAEGKEQWIWGGDWWESTRDQLKSHDLQLWVPFEFGPDGLPLVLKNVPKFHVEL
eukprot:TRINITY_DN18112_c0_g1_i1.p1 TRINITY_DN18112_c0_g1~~TRINITY_DN18112_c0_g1_i1.p1  ORF type:complete len:391 (+),score=39.73 TRINITY_DN18112_c0_g1_i1:234-1406(+)